MTWHEWIIDGILIAAIIGIYAMMGFFVYDWWMRRRNR